MKKVTGKTKIAKENPMIELWGRQNPFGTRSKAALAEKLEDASLVDVQSMCIKAGLSATLPIARLKENIMREFDKFSQEEVFAAQSHQYTVMGKPQGDESVRQLEKELAAIHAGK